MFTIAEILIYLVDDGTVGSTILEQVPLMMVKVQPALLTIEGNLFAITSWKRKDMLTITSA